MNKLALIVLFLLLLSFNRANAASAFVQFKFCPSAVTTLTCPALTPTASNTLVIMGHIVAATGAVSVAGNSNTYTQKVSTTSGGCTAIGGGGRAMFMFEADAINAGSTTVVITAPAGVTVEGYVVEVSGIAAGGFDQSDCNTAVSDTPSAGPTGTTAFANEMDIVLLSCNCGSSAALPSGYTNISTNVSAAGHRIAYKNVTATGTQDATSTISSTNWWGLIVTLKDTVQPATFTPQVGGFIVGP